VNYKKEPKKRRQKTDPRYFVTYMQLKLPTTYSYLAPIECSLARVGGLGDGGYVIHAEDKYGIEVLFSVGISDDWSFEQEIAKHSPQCTIYGYDRTSGSAVFSYYFLREILSNQKITKKLGLLKKWMSLTFTFAFFWNRRHKFCRKWIVLEKKNEKEISITEAFEKIPADKKIGIKIDIEGNEYEIGDKLVDQIKKRRSNVRFFVIEFHDVSKNLDQFLSLTVSQENLAPEKFTNYEIGAKWDVQPNLNLTLAVFQLERSNATTPDPLNPLASINIGKTRTQGVELAATGKITSLWQVHGGYSYQDAKLVGNNSVRLGQVPKQQASLWNRYDLHPNFAVGLGIIHQSSQFAAIRTTANTTKLPAFTRIDAALFYDVSDTVQLQMNVENLLDANYYSDAHNNNNISTGAPINGRFTIRAQF
jgi:hypothetical protein